MVRVRKEKEMKKVLMALVVMAARAASAELKIASVNMMELVAFHPRHDDDKKLLKSKDAEYKKRLEEKRDAIDKIEKEFAGAIAKAAIYVSPNQVVNFVECCETRAATVSPAETGARSCVLCLLCNTSYKYDTGFDWDPVRMDFANGTGRGITLGRRGCCNGWKVEV